MDPRKHTPRHIISALPKMKDKERILKAARKKETVTYKGVPIRLSADFSKETLQVRWDWKEVLQVMKGKGLHPRLLYPAKLSFRMEGQIKCFPDKVKGTYLRNRRSKTMNSKITTNSQLPTTGPKKQTQIINRKKKQTKYNQRH